MVSTRTMSSGEASSHPNEKQSTSRYQRQVEKHREEPAIVASTSANVEPEISLNLQYLPPEIIEGIVGYLSSRNVAQLRMVSRTMNAVCGGILNFKFKRLQAQMLSQFQEIKAKMPRRESARRNHPLACESDIVETLHMRLTLLQMTFGKHIKRKHCCFFAGEILDECYRVLRYIKTAQKLARPHKVTDELYDLTTMAMEYFKEHIEPRLPEITYSHQDFLDLSDSDCEDLHGAREKRNKAVKVLPEVWTKSLVAKPQAKPELSNMVLRRKMTTMKQELKRYNNEMTKIRREVRGCRKKMAEQDKQILDYRTRLDEHDKKKDEYSRKFQTIMQVVLPGGWSTLNVTLQLTDGAGQGTTVEADAQPVPNSNKCEVITIVEEDPQESKPPVSKRKMDNGASSNGTLKKVRRVPQRLGKKPKSTGNLD